MGTYKIKMFFLNQTKTLLSEYLSTNGYIISHPYLNALNTWHYVEKIIGNNISAKQRINQNKFKCENKIFDTNKLIEN